MLGQRPWGNPRYKKLMLPKNIAQRSTSIDNSLSKSIVSSVGGAPPFHKSSQDQSPSVALMVKVLGVCMRTRYLPFLRTIKKKTRETNLRTASNLWMLIKTEEKQV